MIVLKYKGSKNQFHAEDISTFNLGREVVQNAPWIDEDKENSKEILRDM